jgi:hypothetical protein
MNVPHLHIRFAIVDFDMKAVKGPASSCLDFATDLAQNIRPGISNFEEFSPHHNMYTVSMEFEKIHSIIEGTKT